MRFERNWKKREKLRCSRSSVRYMCNLHRYNKTNNLHCTGRNIANELTIHSCTEIACTFLSPNTKNLSSRHFKEQGTILYFFISFSSRFSLAYGSWCFMTLAFRFLLSFEHTRSFISTNFFFVGRLVVFARLFFCLAIEFLFSHLNTAHYNRWRN